MKVVGLERDNTTLAGSPDPWGWRYSSSFELYPFHEGNDRAVYKGILNGKGPKRGRFCAVKAKLDVTASREDWRHVHDIVRKAHALARSFNNLVQSRAISFEWPMIAELEAVSDFTSVVKLFKPHDKKIHKGEMVLIEDFIDGEFQRFSSAVGWVRQDARTDVTQAFSHYTWHATRDLVVCGLQGVASGQGQHGHVTFRLTTPTIHSSCRQYGLSDGGVAGIKEFFSSHRCNNICSAWSGPDVPEMKKFQQEGDVSVHGLKGFSPAVRNQPRRNRNLFPLLPGHHLLQPHLPDVAVGGGGVGVDYAAAAAAAPVVVAPQSHQLHADYIPRVPSAPVFESTRF